MKKIIITGANSGIGRATADILISEGFALWLLARREEAVNELRAAYGEGVRVSLCDVRNYEQVRAFSEDVKLQWGKPDVLINNAGVGFFDPLHEGKIEEWHEMVDTNIKGVLNCIHAFLPLLMEAGGEIINLGSVASHNVFPNSGVYCATKHAVFAISESIRLELPDKVRVTTISPGSVNTPFIEKTSSPEMLRQYKDYFAGGLSAEIVAEQILHALRMPPGTQISEIVVRPSRAVR